MDTTYYHAEKLKRFVKAHRRMPSYSEMLTVFGFRSKNAVAKTVAKLEEAGILGRDRTGKLIPLFAEGEIKLAGYVEAGLPAPAEAAELDTVTIADIAMPKAEGEVYALRVKGDSMIDAGIHSGDTVIVERREAAKAGDIVIANIDGEWTMKYLRHGGSGPYLEAANPDYPDLYPETSLSVGGVVIGVVRAYR